MSRFYEVGLSPPPGDILPGITPRENRPGDNPLRGV